MRCCYLPILALIVVIVLGCQRRSEQRAERSPEKASTAPTFAFLQDSAPLAPWEWAGIPIPDANADSNRLLRSVNFNSVVERRAKSEDHANLLIDNRGALIKLGSLADLQLDWQDQHMIALGNGSTVSAYKIAGYFNAIAALLEGGDIREYCDGPEMGNALLVLGYSLFRSDAKRSTLNARILMLGGAWSAAFTLRKVCSSASGDSDASAIWADRFAELEAALRHMHAERLKDEKE